MSAPVNLRVLMLISQFHPLIGGAEKQAFSLSKDLAARGHLVDVLTLSQPRCPEEEVLDGVRVLRKIRPLPGNFIWGLSYFFSAMGYLVRHRGEYDVYHGHQYQGFHNGAAVVVGRLTGVPVIIKVANTGEGSDVLILKGHRRGRLLGAVHRRADRIVCTTEAMRREVLEMGLDPPRITVIPNGVSPAPAAPGPSLGERFGTGKGSVTIGAVARLHPNKAVDVLLDAFSLLLKARPSDDLRLLVIGDGPSRPGLEARAGELGLSRQIRFCGWVRDVSSSLGELSLLVLPSLVEGFPNVLLEAMVSKVPVVVSDIPPHREILEGERLGRLARRGDPGDLARVMGEALDSREESGRRAALARKTALEEYSMERVAGDYISLYRELLGERGACRGAAD